jgi:uncharacterized membrane protein
MSPPGEPESQAHATVDLQSVYKDRLPRHASVHQRGSYLERAGVSLFVYVLVLTMVVLAVLFTYLFVETPAWTLPASGGGAVDTLQLRLVSEQRELAFERFLRATERIVSSTLLPVLTAILGYIFGRPRTNREDDA